MKLILVLFSCFFLIGCCDSDIENTNRNQIYMIWQEMAKQSMSISALQTELASVQIHQSPEVSVKECVEYIKQIDTHAVASVTIPVSGTYRYKDWSDKWHERDFKAGDVLGSLKQMMNKNCQGYYAVKL